MINRVWVQLEHKLSSIKLQAGALVSYKRRGGRLIDQVPVQVEHKGLEGVTYRTNAVPHAPAGTGKQTSMHAHTHTHTQTHTHTRTTRCLPAPAVETCDHSSAGSCAPRLQPRARKGEIERESGGWRRERRAHMLCWARPPAIRAHAGHERSQLTWKHAHRQASKASILMHVRRRRVARARERRVAPCDPPTGRRAGES